MAATPGFPPIRTWHHTFSPLVIGSMAATKIGAGIDHRKLVIFQSPCHRVNGCNLRLRSSCPSISPLSVPLSSGQWLQLAEAFDSLVDLLLSVPLSSGQWLQPGVAQVDVEHARLSVPLSSGQWLQLREKELLSLGVEAFSPLVIGSMAATRTRRSATSCT